MGFDTVLRARTKRQLVFFGHIRLPINIARESKHGIVGYEWRIHLDMIVVLFTPGFSLCKEAAQSRLDWFNVSTD